MSQCNLFYVRPFLSYDSDFYGVHIQPTTITHPQAKMVCIATQEFAEGEIVGFYCCTLICKKMLDVCNARGVYKESATEAIR